MLKAIHREGLSLTLLAINSSVGYHYTSHRQWAESPVLVMGKKMKKGRIMIMPLVSL
jgi:hypothetical protein